MKGNPQNVRLATVLDNLSVSINFKLIQTNNFTCLVTLHYSLPTQACFSLYWCFCTVWTGTILKHPMFSSKSGSTHNSRKTTNNDSSKIAMNSYFYGNRWACTQLH